MIDDYACVLVCEYQKIRLQVTLVIEKTQKFEFTSVKSTFTSVNSNCTSVKIIY